MPFVGNSGQVNTLYEKNESSPGTSVRIVSGEVGTEISASGGLNLSIPLSTVTQVGNVTNDIVSFTNPQTGITVSSNAHVGGNMSAGYYYGDGSNLVGVSATTISPGASLSVNQVTTSGDLIVGGQIQGNFQNAVAPGSYLNGLSYDGSTQRTFDVDATITATANKVVARDTSGRVYATSFHGDGSQLTGLPSTVNSTDDVPEGSSNQYYTDNRVDTHLNTGIATSGQVLSWNGSDYTWAVNGSGGIDTTQTLALTNATTGLTVSSNAVVTGNVTADYFVGDGGLLSNVESVRTFILGTNGSSDYTFTGPGFTSSTNDPVLILLRGVKYVFDNTANYQSHPFNIRLQSGGVNYTNGVVNNGSGITEFTVPMDAPSTLYYQCTFHTSMGNIIKIIDNLDTTQTFALSNATTGLTVSSNAVVTGNVTASSFIGDGSQLTGLPSAVNSTDDVPEGSSNQYYTDNRVDTHLNTGIATSGQVLSWNGSDYAWAVNGSGGIDTTQTFSLSNVTTGLIVSSNAVVTGNVTASSFIGDGSQLTGLPSAVNSTDDVPEGSSNQYYTDNKVDTHLNTGVATSGQVLSWNGSDYTWAVNGSGGIDTTQTFALSNATTGLTVSSNAVVTGNVTASSFIGDGSQLTGLPSAVNSTDDVPEGSSNQYYTDNRVDTHLNTGIATSGQVLSWNGSDYAWAVNGSGGIDTTQTFSLSNVTTGLIVSSNAVVTGNVTAGSFIGDGSQLTGLPSAVNSTDDVPEGSSNQYYTDNRVDTHLNTGIATSGQVLSWNGSDYAWAVNGSGGIDTTQTFSLSNVTTGLIVSSNAVVTGNVTADYFVGDGSNLTGISGGIDTTQTLALSNATTGLIVSSNAVVTGNVTADYFVGDGSNLTGISGGIDTTQTLALSNATTGLTVSSNIEADILKLTTGIYQDDSLVFIKETASDWSQVGLDIDGEAYGDQSGFSVSLSSDGTIVAIGAYNNDGTGTDAGHVRVYEWTGTAWTQVGLDIDGEAAGDLSGWSVSLSSDGTVVAIGATYNNGTASNAGHVRVYEWTGTAWSQRGLDIDGEAAADYSGGSVSLSSDGTVVAIGAYTNDGNGSNAGHVRVWEWTGTAWSQRGLDIDGEAAGDQSGRSVSLSSDGSVVAIGANSNDGTASNAGHVRVYEWTGTAWSQRGLDIDGEGAGDQSGYSVSLSPDGTVVAVPSHQYGQGRGRVRVYEWTGTAWSQRGLAIDSEATGDQFGRSVSLSSDGSVLAIGAIFNDGAGSDSGHVRVYEWTGTAWSQIGLDIDGEAGGDYSGMCVSLSSDGSIVAIGAPRNDGTAGYAGHVRVYALPSWTTLEADYIHGDGSNITNISGTVDTTQTLALSNATTGLTVSSNAVVTGNVTADYFVGDGSNLTGISGGVDTTQTLALSNVTTGLTVSSNIEANILKLTTGMYHSDSLVLSKETGSDWVQRGLDIDGEAADDQSGYSVSLSSDGTVVAIGAINNDGTGSNAGHVRVWEWTGTAWSQRGLDIDGEAAGDQSGWSVSLSSDGSVVAIGAINNDGTGTDAGHVRVWEWTGSAWSQRGLDIDGEAAGDNSGYSVSLSSDGTVVAIGANKNDGTGSNAGHVRVWEWTGSAWSKRGLDIDAESSADNSGYSVSLSSDGTVVAIGAHYNDGAGSNAGHVRVYRWTGSAWSKRGLDIDGEAVNDFSGYSVSLSSDGTVVAIGATGNDGTGSNAGHVRVWEWTGSAWSKRGLDIDGEAASNYSGYSVSLSSDGTVVAIGANYNHGAGSNAGHVRVWEWTGSAWSQVGLDIDGEAVGDQSGNSVSLSSDGTVVAIGAYYNDGAGSNAGHVRVYELPSLTKLEVDYIHGDGSNLRNISGTVDTTQTLALSNATTGLTVSSNTLVSGNVTADYFVGDGSNLTNISGTVDTTQTLALSNATTGLTVSSNAVVTGNVTADYFVGDGSNLTGISGGIDTTQTLALSNATTGLTVSSNAVVTGNLIGGDIFQVVTSGGNIIYDDQLTTTPFSGTLVGVTRTTATTVDTGYLQMNTAGSQDHTVYWNGTLGESWTCTFEWYKQSDGADDLRFIFYAPNEITSYNPATHGGSYVFIEFYEGDSFQIHNSSGTSVSSYGSINWADSAWVPFTITYNNGVLTASADNSGTNVSISYDFGTTFQSYYTSSSYFGFSGRTGGVSINQRIRNISIDEPVVNTSIPYGSQLLISSNTLVSGNVTADYFVGDGSNLVNVPGTIDTTQTLALTNGATGLAVSSNIEADILKLTTGMYHNDSLVLSKETGSDWVQRGLDIDGEAADDQSGYSVSLSSDGTVVAIGAIYNDGTASNAGHVRVWEWTGTAWSQRGLDIDGEAAGDWSGYSVSLSSDGTVVAIGAIYNDGTNGADSGHVRVWEWTGSAWSQRGLDIDGEAGGDLSGNSVSLSSDGTVVAIGAISNDGAGTNAGHVRVWEWTGSAWSKRGLDLDGEAANDISGRSVSLSSDGTVVAIGAYYNDGTGTIAGHVRVYEWTGATWFQRGLDIDGEAEFDLSGYSVSLSSDGTVIAIGAPQNDGYGTFSGHVRVWEWDGSAWSQRGLDIDGEAANDESGSSVSLSSDGTVVAIGAIKNDGTGTDAGHVRVWEWTGSAWVQRGLDIDGEAASDQSGTSVSLSSDGTVVAIGALYNDGTGSNAGHVRVYALPSWSQLEVDQIYTTANVGIATSTAAYTLDVNGQIYASGAITENSDLRKKSNLEIIPNPIEKITQISGYTYDMNNTRRTGLIAQEVLDILPEAVVGNEEQGYGLAYGNIIGILVEAIKKLNERITILENN